MRKDTIEGLVLVTVTALLAYLGSVFLDEFKADRAQYNEVC